jgi:hypothetical protein
MRGSSAGHCAAFETAPTTVEAIGGPPPADPRQGPGLKPTRHTAVAGVRMSAPAQSHGSSGGGEGARSSEDLGPGLVQVALTEQPRRCDVVEARVHPLEPCLDHAS